MLVHKRTSTEHANDTEALLKEKEETLRTARWEQQRENAGLSYRGGVRRAKDTMSWRAHIFWAIGIATWGM